MAWWQAAWRSLRRPWRRSADPDTSSESGKPAHTALPAQERPLILVVDDHVDTAEGLAAMLAAEGYDACTAYDGASAIEQAAARRPDAILLDIGLPRLNGYDTCRAIRDAAWGKDVAIIAVTGWGGDDERRRSRAAGFDAHVVKPLYLPELLLSLSLALGRGSVPSNASFRRGGGGSSSLVSHRRQNL